jgi:hypothetical protein
MTTRYATTPCRGCGKQIVFVTAAGGQTVPLDPSKANEFSASRRKEST